jgi:hypothetical protein
MVSLAQRNTGSGGTPATSGLELEIGLRKADRWRQRHPAKQDRLEEIHGVFFQLGVPVEVSAFAS